MRTLAILLSALCLVTPVTVVAKGDSEVAALADCGWNQASRSALALSEMKAKKSTIYDNHRSLNAGAFMRVYAACHVQYLALSKVIDKDEISYQLVRAIQKRKPKNIPADAFDSPVFRCEAHFPDRDEASDAPLIWWDFGEDRSARQLGSISKMYNTQVKITAGDIAAIEKRGNGVANLAALLKQTEEQDIVEAETYEDGMASGQAFRIKPTEANSTCKYVAPSGELTNA